MEKTYGVNRRFDKGETPTSIIAMYVTNLTRKTSFRNYATNAAIGCGHESKSFSLPKDGGVSFSTTRRNL